FFDAEFERIYRDLQQQLPGYEISLQSNDKDESLFVVAAANDRTQGVRYLYEVATKRLARLADIAPWLEEKNLVQVKPITYQSRDGLTIHGYLTLPPGGGQKLPPLVNPHRGPWGRDRA